MVKILLNISGLFWKKKPKIMPYFFGDWSIDPAHQSSGRVILVQYLETSI